MSTHSQTAGGSWIVIAHPCGQARWPLQEWGMQHHGFVVDLQSPHSRLKLTGVRLIRMCSIWLV
ncbi:MAG: hypothetical protein ACM34E_14345, partial [Acidobacteriota bacterium]